MTVTTDLVYPVAHYEVEPDCYGCWWVHRRGKGCGEVCKACACRWELDVTGEPNPKYEQCDGCDCHTWELAESRARVEADDSLEAAWREQGYVDSLQVYNAEGR